MTKYENNLGEIKKNSPSYICGDSEFTLTTDAKDGSNLEVVNEVTHKVIGYYVAYNGYWNER